MVQDETLKICTYTISRSLNPKIKSENLKIQLKSLKPTYNPLKSTFSDFAKNFHLDYFNDAESENQGPEI